MRVISILLIAVLLSHSPLSALARTLDKNETWSGQISLEEDLVVPPPYSLTISPGTQVFTNGNKIISYGKVSIRADKKSQVKFLPLTITGTSEIEVVKVRPYNVNTKILKDEFQKFKVEYAILWSFLFATMFFMMTAAK